LPVVAMPQPPHHNPHTPDALSTLQLILLLGLLCGVLYGQTGWAWLGWLFGLLCAAPLALLVGVLVLGMVFSLIGRGR